MIHIDAWLIKTIVTLSLMIMASGLLIVMVKAWSMAFDSLLGLLNIKKDFVLYVWSKYSSKRRSHVTSVDKS